MAVSDGLDTDHELVSFPLLFQMQKTTQRRNVYRGSLFQRFLPMVDWLHRCRCVMMLNIMAAGEGRGTKLLTSWESERARGSNKIFPSKTTVTYLLQADLTSSSLSSMSDSVQQPIDDFSASGCKHLSTVPQADSWLFPQPWRTPHVVNYNSSSISSNDFILLSKDVFIYWWITYFYFMCMCACLCTMYVQYLRRKKI